MTDKPHLLAGRFEPTGEAGEVPGLIPAVDSATRAPVLVRLMRPRDEGVARRMLRDYRMLSRLRHPGLARILEVVEEPPSSPGEPGLLTIIIDPLRGRTLSAAAAAQTMPVGLVLQALEQMALALEFLHTQEPPIYLGRLEPSGIVITPNDQVLLADVASDEIEILSTEVVRSPFWAPEVVARTPATAAQDIYSLGAIGWFLLTGAVPPTGEAHLPADVPAPVNELLRHLLQEEAAIRPPTMRAVLARLESLRGGPQPVNAAPVATTPAPPVKSAVKNSMWDVLFSPLGWRAEPGKIRSAPDDEGESAQAAREQFSILALKDVDLDRDLARMLPESTARSIQGIVVARPADQELILALKDPTFVHAYDYVRLAVGNNFQIRLLRAEPPLVEQALEFVYRSEVYAESVSWPEWLVRRRFHSLALEVENPIADATLWGDPVPSRIIEAVDTVLKEALAVGASDIHFETFRRWMDVRYRIDGVLKRISSFPSEQASAMVKRIKVLANMDIAQEKVPQGGRISVRVGDLECDLRVSVVPVQAGESAVLRVLRKTAERQTLSELGFPEKLQKDFVAMLDQPYGMVLVCGPTGSGKTTTLYSSLKMLERPDRKLLTVEDPVEYEMAGVTQVQVDTSPREVEKRVTFARVLREFLRQDPDVILVGEIRDPETAEVAVQAALTGHLLLSTLHANDSLGVFARLREMGIEPFLIGTSLLGALAQRLARRICDGCREETEVPESLKERMARAGVEQPRAYRGRGCPACLGSGYRGRVGLYELALVTPAVRRCILEGAGETELLAALESDGRFWRLQDHGLQLAAQGIISLDEVLRVTRNN